MKVLNETPNACDLLDSIWLELATAAQSRHHPWHLMQLATIRNKAPTIRTLVLRDADQASSAIIAHTDIRSPKVPEIQNNPEVCWHAYDPGQRVQIRLRGRAMINHQDAYAEQRWEATSLNSRLCYANVHAPSHDLETCSELHHNSVSKAEFDAGLAKKNFAVLTSVVNRIDWLHLKHQGHCRARFDLKDGLWEHTWLAP